MPYVKKLQLITAFRPIGGDVFWRTVNEAVWKSLDGRPAHITQIQAKDSMSFWSGTFNFACANTPNLILFWEYRRLELIIQHTEQSDAVEFSLGTVW